MFFFYPIVHSWEEEEADRAKASSFHPLFPNPTKPTTPSLHPIQGSQSPRHPADLNLATAPGTTLLQLPFGHASYACQSPTLLQHAPFRPYTSAESNEAGAFHCGLRLCKEIGLCSASKEEEDQPNSGPLCTFAEADQLGILEKGRELVTEGGSRNEGGGKLLLLECKLIPILCPFLWINTAQSSPVSYLWSLSSSSFMGLSLVSQVPPLPSVARAFLERESPTFSNFLPKSSEWPHLIKAQAHQKLAHSDIYFFLKRSCPIVLIRKVDINPLESECQLVQQNPPLLKGGSEPAAKRFLKGEVSAVSTKMAWQASQLLDSCCSHREVYVQGRYLQRCHPSALRDAPVTVRPASSHNFRAWKGG
ncbi:hypothetical protein TIFTF001_029701 [Ficus carica]|uniref:Uncharacterized protein n=1 Tax=Ficus carica TaxID=3494 RepID=A0AA88DS59_FICCA|nr:hypothetical protein TIFTF001_029701 [Ficus carica]